MLESTVPDTAYAALDDLAEALIDRADLRREVHAALYRAFDTIASANATSFERGNARRIVMAAIAAFDALAETPEFGTARDVRLSLCEAAFAWRGTCKSLVSSERSLPTRPAAFEINGRTVH
jgi:hypothetical protein